MEEKNNVKRERIDSFRLEVWEEYKNATNIKKRLICFTQHDPQAAAMTTVAMKHDTMVTPTTATPNTTNNTNLNLNTHPLTHLTLN
ncbi:hypothetical protein BDB01DRAFT_721653 [Pilobolus umbonatus]|nr:hypothetical protein BDB01DRAFT_721653 [Pilobolus umbonatus]